MIDDVAELLAEVRELREHVDDLREFVKSMLTDENEKLDRLAYKLGIAPFAVGQHVTMKSSVASWNRHDEVVMVYNGSYTKFKNEYGDWKNVADYE